MGIIQDCSKCEQPEVRRAVIYPLKGVKSQSYSIEGTGSNSLKGQDTYCIIENLEEDCHFFGVFDGFGTLGKEASLTVNQYVKTYFEINSTRLKVYEYDYQIEDFVKELFEGAENKLKSNNAPNQDVNSSGTCSCCLYIKKNKAYIINLGNSRVALCRTTASGYIQPIDLSSDHRVDRREEKKRITNQGGKISSLTKFGKYFGPERIWNDEGQAWMTASRGLGGFSMNKKGFSNQADIEVFELYQFDKFLIIASDGLWDAMRTEEVVEFVNTQDRSKDVAKLLVNEARRRWEETNKEEFVGIGDDPQRESGYDDITVIIVYLSFYSKEEIEEYKSYARTMT